MKYSIDNYITAIVAGNFCGELQGTSAPLDHLGKPTFRLHRDHITFVVNRAGEPKLLTIPFEVNGPQLAEIVHRTRQSERFGFMAGKSFVPDGVIVYDESGVPHSHHALVEPYHTNLHNFVRQNHSSSRKPLLRSAIEINVFKDTTNTQNYSYTVMPPYMLIDINYGHFPTYIFLEKGKFKKAFNYKEINENEIVEFLNY